MNRTPLKSVTRFYVDWFIFVNLRPGRKVANGWAMASCLLNRSSRNLYINQAYYPDSEAPLLTLYDFFTDPDLVRDNFDPRQHQIKKWILLCYPDIPTKWENWDWMG